MIPQIGGSFQFYWEASVGRGVGGEAFAFITMEWLPVKIDNERGDFRYFVINKVEMLNLPNFLRDNAEESCIIQHEVMGFL